MNNRLMIIFLLVVIQPALFASEVEPPFERTHTYADLKVDHGFCMLPRKDSGVGCVVFSNSSGEDTLAVRAKGGGASILCTARHLAHDAYGIVLEVEGSCGCGDEDNPWVGSVVSTPENAFKDYLMIISPQDKNHGVLYPFSADVQGRKAQHDFTRFSLQDDHASMVRVVRQYTNGTECLVKVSVFYDNLQEAIVEWGISGDLQDGEQPSSSRFRFHSCLSCGAERMHIGEQDAKG